VTDGKNGLLFLWSCCGWCQIHHNNLYF
jgi:hypothetical protein